MDILRKISPTRTLIDTWKRSGARIAFVPTMGNLHKGHLRLVEEARRQAEQVVVSIFVNPMQFGPNEDYANYPRTFEQDVSALKKYDVDLLFAPEVREIYPRPLEEQTRVEVPDVTEILCGAFRPGHFTGVTTVVNKLFNIVQPHVAVFGKKDFQQLVVIKTMVEDLCLPIEISGVDTVRETDGLAMSSRNNYLTQDERKRAPEIYKVLSHARQRIQAGERDFNHIEQQSLQRLEQAGFQPEYFSIREAHHLSIPEPQSKDLVLLTTAKIGKTRLIDNVSFSLSK